MSREHFCGTWQISKCFLNEKLEKVGLEGIKFRLDELGDITWYNDLVHLAAVTGRDDFNDISESADVLFSCETFEVQGTSAGSQIGPRLLFAAFAGYSIEFKVDSMKPDTTLSLFCDGWYTLLCNRVEPEHQSTGQEDSPFTLLGALNESSFSDGLIECAEGDKIHIHSSILRLNGFDSTTCTAAIINSQQQSTTASKTPPTNEITISVIPPTTPSATTTTAAKSSSSSSFLLSPKLLISPTLEMFHLPSKLASNLSNSFNCLSASIKQQQHPADDPFTLLRNTISTSDSNLKSSLNHHHHQHHHHQQQQHPASPHHLHHHSASPSPATTRQNIFTFAGDFVYRQPRGCPPLSPYRSKSPLWTSMGSSADTPPSSPLTPAEVLCALPAALLTPICHWLYAECLPAGLDEDTLDRLIGFTDGISRLAKMTELCHSYLQKVRLKKLVISIVSDVHNCLNRMVDALNPANLVRTPESLWISCKNCGREVVFACSKVLQFCNIFVKDSHSLSRTQRHEIIKYVRSRLPIFLAQAHQLLQNIMCILSTLADDEKTDLVFFLVPEIKASLSLASNIVAEIKYSLQSMYDDLRSNCTDHLRTQTGDRPFHRHRTTSGGSAGAPMTAASTTGTRFRRPSQFEIPLFKHHDRSTKNLKFVLYIYELKKMKDVYGRISTALEIVEEKRLAFEEMSIANKRETIRQNLEQLIAEIPDFILKIEYMSSNLEDLNGWKEFKFFFKLATNQINGVISKLLDHRTALNEAVAHICTLIDKKSFTSTLIELGLLDSRSVVHGSLHDSLVANESLMAPNLYTNRLNLTQTCCEPPRNGHSSLSKNALRLLHSGQFSDMEFEIIVPPADQSQPPSSTDSNRKEPPDPSTAPVQVHVFRAHRVIVATRCDWFHKALSSGMQESINRKITIHDTSPVIFRRLLLYLYGAPVDKTVGAEQLCELMLLADRFSVDVLKDICESTLKSLIDDDSVLCLLAIADRLNAPILKANCFSFISQHSDVTKADIFNDLPKSLQTEVRDLLHWCGRIPEPWRERKSSKKRSHKSPTPSATST